MTTFYMDIHDDLFYSRTGHDAASYFRSAFIEVRKTAENDAQDGFGANFMGAAFCLAQPAGGLLVMQNNFSRVPWPSFVRRQAQSKSVIYLENGLTLNHTISHKHPFRSGLQPHRIRRHRPLISIGLQLSKFQKGRKCRL